MPVQLDLNGVMVDVSFKDIKNIHLSVYPPIGRVHISAPARMSLDAVRIFAIRKLAWIRQQQEKQLHQARESPRELIERESHYVWGQRYLLRLQEVDAAPMITIDHKTLILSVRPGTTAAGRAAVMAHWYRKQVREAALPVIRRWEPLLEVQLGRLFVQRMKTQWGTCTPARRSIRLNTDLGQKPRECLEYIVLHEMVHLLVPSHDSRFTAVMDRHLPNWRIVQRTLNSLPLSHSDWVDQSQ